MRIQDHYKPQKTLYLRQCRGWSKSLGNIKQYSSYFNPQDNQFHTRLYDFYINNSKKDLNRQEKTQSLLNSNKPFKLFCYFLSIHHSGSNLFFLLFDQLQMSRLFFRFRGLIFISFRQVFHQIIIKANFQASNLKQSNQIVQSHQLLWRLNVSQYIIIMSFQNPKIKITGIVFQNKHGSKYYSRYYHNKKDLKNQYDLSVQENQRKFEQQIRNKIQRMNVMSTLKPEQTQIFTTQSYAVLFKLIDQLQIYLIVPEDQNYVLMEEVINIVGEVLLMITKGPYTGKIIFDYLQDIVLVSDEIINQGYIACLDPQKIFERIRMKDLGASSPVLNTNSSKPTQPPPQQAQSNNQGVGGTFSSLFGFARNTLNKTLNLG